MGIELKARRAHAVKVKIENQWLFGVGWESLISPEQPIRVVFFEGYTPKLGAPIEAGKRLYDIPRSEITSMNREEFLQNAHMVELFTQPYEFTVIRDACLSR